MGSEDLRLAELLAALSVATDLGMGQAPEKAVRSCLVATGLARHLELSERQVHDVYYTTLLRHLGCTATAADEARAFGGDELVSRPAAERADFGSPREMLALTLGTGRGTGLARPGLVARAFVAGRHVSEILTAVCEVGAHLAGRLGLGEGVRRGLYEALERWDGKGQPAGLRGDAIALPARVAEVATHAVVIDREGGPDAAVASVVARAGSWFDPEVAAAFGRHGAGLLRKLAATDPWEAVVAAEPQPVRRIAPVGLDAVAETFGDFADLKSPYTRGHSSGVARLAVRGASSLGLGRAETVDLRRAALLHDLGRVAVSNGIWDKAGPLTRADREKVRLHAYHSERILGHSPTLAPIGRLAGLHHERLDGTGYHRGARVPELPVAGRLLAACDAFQAMTEDRPHRRPHSPEQAADLLAAEAAAGRLDTEAVRAVSAAAGAAADDVPAAPWPADLTDREVEVLRLVAHGRSNREIAAELTISKRTAEHHVQHIYAKIGTSTRAAAAVFAMEHGLLRT